MMHKKIKIIVIVQLLSIAGVLLGMFAWNHIRFNRITRDATYSEWTVYEAPPTADDPAVEINSIEDWIRFSENVNSGNSYYGQLISLNQDLDFSGYRVNPIGNRDNPFEGIFNGNGHTLRNLKMDLDERFVGVFGLTQNAVITGINLMDCEIHSSSATGTGGIVGRSIGGTINDCTFSGIVRAEKGSAGGIVGNNWSHVHSCAVIGTVAGSTKVNVSYEYNGWSCYCGTGGIAGDNGDVISKCINYAEIYDTPEVAHIASGTTGGIAYRNCGWIESCSNFGPVYGGGIVNSNKAVVRGCFNFGCTNAGIAVSCSEGGSVEQCVNYGEISLNDSADIVQCAGSLIVDYDWGSITKCLYTNTSGWGPIYANLYEECTIEDNYLITPLSDPEKKQVIASLEAGNYSEALEFIRQREYHPQDGASTGAAVMLCLVVLLADGVWLVVKLTQKARIYAAAVKCAAGGEYHRGGDLFAQIPDYRDAEKRGQCCVAKALGLCTEDSTIEFGKIDGKRIPWIQIGETENGWLLLSKYALVAECIHAEPGPVSWECSDLYQKLNADHKAEWFNPIEQSFIAGDISILSVTDLQRIFSGSEQRKCRAINRLTNILRVGENVFWWIRQDQSAAVSKMPFVTPDGLISETGKNVTAASVAVRPVLEVRIHYENNNKNTPYHRH